MAKPKSRYTDRWGTYYAIPNKAGEVARLANVSGLSKLLSSYPLERYKLKTVARVIAAREDLQLLAATGGEDDAVKQALDSSWQKANIGTAIHSITEMIDADTFEWEFCPAAARPFAMQYIRAKETLGWSTVKAEYTVFNFEYGYAGTCDRALFIPQYGPVAVIADIKTGSVYSEVAIQLGAYANAEGIWVQDGTEPGDGHHEDAPQVRRDIAVAIRLHADGCELVPVDISDAPRVLRALRDLREWKDRKDILGKVLDGDTKYSGGGDAGGGLDGASAGAAAPDDDQDRHGVRTVEGSAELSGHADTTTSGDPAGRLAEGGEVRVPDSARPGRNVHADSPSGNGHVGIAGRPDGASLPAPGPTAEELAARVAALPPDAKAWMAPLWPQGVETFKRATRPHTADELDRVRRLVEETESKFRVPFPDADAVEPEPSQLTPDQTVHLTDARDSLDRHTAFERARVLVDSLAKGMSEEDALQLVEDYFPGSTVDAELVPFDQPITEHDREAALFVLGQQPKDVLALITAKAEAEGLGSVRSPEFSKRQYSRLFNLVMEAQAEAKATKKANEKMRKGEGR